VVVGLPKLGMGGKGVGQEAHDSLLKAHSSGGKLDGLSSGVALGTRVPMACLHCCRGAGAKARL
jgi:hypothetical protein